MTFPSGAATLDMKTYGLLLTFEYSPEEGFAVSRIENIEDAWDPQKCVFFGKEGLDDAKAYFLFLIEKSQDS